MNHLSVMRWLLVPLLGLALLAQAAEQAPESAANPAAAGKPDEQAGLSEEVVGTMNALVEAAIQHAGRELEKGVDEFLPYGVLQLASGEARMVQWQKPNPPPLPEVMRAIFLTMVQAARAPEVLAAVTVAPTAVNTEQGIVVKGLRCEVDHRDGEPRIVFVPYTRENGKVLTGTPVYLPGKNPVFLRPGEQAQGAAMPANAAPAKGKNP